MSREEFDTMSYADRVAALLIEEPFGPEDLVPTVADLLEQTAISNGLHRWACEGGSIEVPANVLGQRSSLMTTTSVSGWPDA